MKLIKQHHTGALTWFEGLLRFIFRAFLVILAMTLFFSLFNMH